MTLRRLLLLSLPFALALIANAAPAQSLDNDWTGCREGESAEAVVTHCTALIESGRLGENERAEVLSNRAFAYRFQRDYPHAIADYEEGLRLNPRAIWAHAGLATTYRASGVSQRAISEYDVALRLAENELGNAGPRSAEYPTRLARVADIYRNRGVAYEELHDSRRALADFREAYRRAPHDPESANSLCWGLATLGENLDEARAACDQSLRDRPNHPPTLDSRGLVGLKQHRFQDAWNDYDAAVRLQPEGPSWLYGRGIAALRLGRTAEGRADIARAEALVPEIRQFYADFGITP